jgi:hypothetical protein
MATTKPGRGKAMFSSGLGHYSSTAPKKGGYDITLNVTTPYCPITSDGKAPDLSPFANAIMEAISAATRKAQRAAPKDKRVTQKSIILDNLDDVVADVSGDDEFRFNSRQVFYQLRPIVQEETGQALQESYFAAVITD